MLFKQTLPGFLRSYRARVALIATVLPVVALSAAVAQLREPAFQPVQLHDFLEVQHEPFELLLSQMGPVESAKNTAIINRCEYSTRIISVVPEGTWVNEGDVVLELDSSKIVERLNEQEIQVVQAEKLLKDAEEDVRIQELTNASRIAAAELKAQLADLQARGYLEAEYPRTLHSLEGAAVLAAEDLNAAEKQHEFVHSMVRLGYRTVSELDNERLKLLKARQTFELAQSKVKILQDFTYNRTAMQLTALAEESLRELERTKSLARTAMMSRNRRLLSRQKTYDLQVETLNRLKENIASCTLRAPRSGEVVLGVGSSSSNTALEEGSSVWFLQTLATIPDRQRLQVSLRIHESRIRLMQIGQLADVVIDAFPHEKLNGRVTSISTVPLSGRFPNYDLKEYKATVEINADPSHLSRIAPGMTAQVAVRAADLPAAIAIPLTSSVQIAGQHYAFVRRGADVEIRPIEIGFVNDQKIEVRSGLDAGEQIVIKPRVSCADRIAWMESQQSMLAAR